LKISIILVEGDRMSEKKKIVLFRPKSSPDKDYLGAPLGLLAIAAPLEKKYDIVIVDALIDDDYLESVLNHVDGAICLGITSMTGYQIQEALEVAKAVKEKYPKVPIVWGGYHSSILPKQTAKSKFVDIIVRGQGVKTFMEIVRVLEKKLPLKKIQGITYKKNNRIISTPDRSFEDINNFPTLPYHLVDVEKYITVSEFANRCINYLSTRGCPFRCAFCAESKVNKGRWSGLKPKRVVDDLENLVKTYKVSGIVFNDNNFFIGEERVRKICQGIVDRKLKISWGGANGRAEQLIRYKESTWKLIKKSGCSSILIGAESGSQIVLDFIQKDTKIKEMLKFTEMCKKYGIRIIFSLMLGFPPVDEFGLTIEEEFRENVKFINKIRSIYENVTFLWFAYTPYPGTPLYEMSKRCGFEEPKTLEEWSRFNLLNRNTPWVDKKYMSLLEQFNTFIFPFTSNTYLRMKTMIKGYKGLRGFVANPLVRMFHRTANFRLKHKFFSMPIEHETIKLGKRLGLLYG